MRAHRIGGDFDDVGAQPLEPRDDQLTIAQHSRGDIGARDVRSAFGTAAFLVLIGVLSVIGNTAMIMALQISATSSSLARMLRSLW